MENLPCYACQMILIFQFFKKSKISKMATRENLGFIFLFSNFTILLLFKFCSWPNTVTPVLTIDKVLLPMEKLHLDKIIFTPSVYLRVMGGLGNQLFQYSCSYTIARKHNIPFYLVSPGQSESGANRR